MDLREILILTAIFLFGAILLYIILRLQKKIPPKNPKRFPGDGPYNRYPKNIHGHDLNEIIKKQAEDGTPLDPKNN